MCERLGANGIVGPSRSQNTNNVSSLPAHGLGELRRLDPLPKTLCSAQQAKLCLRPTRRQEGVQRKYLYFYVILVPGKLDAVISLTASGRPERSGHAAEVHLTGRVSWLLPRV